MKSEDAPRRLKCSSFRRAAWRRCSRRRWAAAVKSDKADWISVNHCCVFGRLSQGVMLLRYYIVLSGLFTATLSAKVYEAADEAELKTLRIMGIMWI